MKVKLFQYKLLLSINPLSINESRIACTIVTGYFFLLNQFSLILFFGFSIYSLPEFIIAGKTIYWGNDKKRGWFSSLPAWSGRGPRKTTQSQIACFTGPAELYSIRIFDSVWFIKSVRFNEFKNSMLRFQVFKFLFQSDCFATWNGLFESKKNPGSEFFRFNFREY